MPLFEIPDVISRAAHYQHRAIARRDGHNELADRNQLYSKVLGVLVTVLTTIVGTSIFASLSKGGSSSTGGNSEVEYKIITGIVSMIAVVLSALQTFLGFHEKSEKNKNASYEYEAINSRLNNFILSYRQNSKFQAEQEMRDSGISSLDKVTALFEKAVQNSPNLSANVEKKYFAILNSKNKNPVSDSA